MLSDDLRDRRKALLWVARPGYTVCHATDLIEEYLKYNHHDEWFTEVPVEDGISYTDTNRKYVTN